MTIIHIINSIAGGGAEQMVYKLCLKSKNQHTTKVISLSGSKTLEEKFKKAGISVEYLNINSFKNLSFLSGFNKLKELIKENNGDMVFHCHQYYAGLLGMFYKMFVSPRTPIIFTLHTNKLDVVRRRFILFIMKMLRKKDIIFSKSSTKWYLKNNAIIPNGVEFDKSSSINIKTYEEEKVFQFLFLGRLNEAKNPLFLVTLVERLVSINYSNFQINIVGEGDLSTPLLEEIKLKNLESYFVFHGYHEKVDPFLNQSHCLILPSIREGMPMVILEAAASLVPIISTPVGSIPDFLNDKNGKVSTLDTFHNAMAEVISDYKKAANKAHTLLNEVKAQFDIDVVYQQHLELYKSAVK